MIRHIHVDEDRLTSSGTLDTSFSTNGAHVYSTNWNLVAMRQTPHGKFLAVGNNEVLRFLSNGALDTIFHTDGSASGATNSIIMNAVAIAPNGKIFAAGQNSTSADYVILSFWP